MRTTLDPTLDIVFKLLFGASTSRDSLIALLTAVLRPPVPITDVRVLNPEIDVEAVGERGIVPDLLVELIDGTRIDVEMQATRRAASRSRSLYYWARTYGGQLQRGQPYADLRPVVSILFLDYCELETERFHPVFRIMEAHEHFTYSDAFELHVVELPKRRRPGAAARQEEADLLAWSRFLGAETDEEVKEACMSNPDVAKANDLLAALSAKPSAKELARQRRLALDTYAIEMTAAKAEGLAEGLRAGIVALAEVLQIELDERRQSELERSTVAELAALRDRLLQERRW